MWWWEPDGHHTTITTVLNGFHHHVEPPRIGFLTSGSNQRYGAVPEIGKQITCECQGVCTKRKQ